MSHLNLDLWNMDGQAFVQLGEDGFKKRRMSQSADSIFPHLPDLWRSSAAYDSQMLLPPSCGQESQVIPRSCGQESLMFRSQESQMLPRSYSEETLMFHQMAPRSCGVESQMGYQMAREAPINYQMIPNHALPPYQGPPNAHHDQVNVMTGQENTNSSTDNYMDIAYMLQMLDSHHMPTNSPQPHHMPGSSSQPQHIPGSSHQAHHILESPQQPHYITPKTEPDLVHSFPPHERSNSLYSVSDRSNSIYSGSDHLSEVGTVMGSPFRADLMDDEEDFSSNYSDEEEAESGKGSPARPGTTNIHLWQFIKELLEQPHHYTNLIHWLDRQKGIFKIVDSVKVANLWGKRKNRPAMNYDKLSRSLRQYYKKGIMKKTERSQRLVYQFCHPYHL